VIKRTRLLGKIHQAVVTEANLEYVGSITIDRTLLLSAGFHEYERVQVVNVDNGNRLETYTIEGEADSGTICLNGAAAHHFAVGDRVIIMNYGQLDEAEIDQHRPQVVFVDRSNRITKVSQYEQHGQIA
jgi:aspartate 1-decarboxylase